MSRTRLSKLLLIALVLALSVSAAYGQITATPTTASPCYGCVSGNVNSQTFAITDVSDGSNGSLYSVTGTVTYGGDSSSYAWLPLLNITSGNSFNSDADNLTASADPTILATMPAGNYTASFTLTSADTTTTVVTVNLLVVTLQSIAVTPSSPTINFGATQQFVATGTYSDTTTAVLTSSVTWASATPGTATIASGGLATSVGVGTTNITASLNGVTSSADVLTVTAVLVSIAVTPASPSIAVGSTQQFVAIGTYSDSSTQTLTSSVTWASATTAKATITSGGLATAVAVGASNITAALNGVTSNTAVLTVTPALVSIAVTPATASIAAGLTQQFVATGTYSDSSTQTLTSSVTWASATTAKATIASSGLATGVAAGTSNITASLNGVTSNTAVLTVTAATLVSIAVTPATPSIGIGGTQQFVATGTYTDASTQTLTSSVTWASATPAKATISSGGLATAVATGTTNITATLSSVTSPAAVLTVTSATLQSIAVTPASPSIAKGATQQFIATGTYSDASTLVITSSVTWASATTAKATITSGGLATGVATGTSNITATLSSVTSPAAVLTVTAAALVSIAVTPANPAIATSATKQFTATGTYTDSTTVDITSSVTWASGTTGTATISSAGLATGVGAGTSIVSATSGLVVGSTTLTVTATTQPLVSNLATIALTFTKTSATSGSVPAATPAIVTVASGGSSTPFTLASNLPEWLSVTPQSGSTYTATTGGQTVEFADSSFGVLNGMSVGNYSTTVKFLATGASSDLQITVTLAISPSTAGAISLAQGTTEIDSFVVPGTTPVPLVTPLSNGGPVSFTASCVVVSAGYTVVPGTACNLSLPTGSGQPTFTPAPSITGVAYNTGTPISTIFDPALFSTNRPLGTVVTLTVTVNSVSLVYKYTLQYGVPTITSATPTSIQTTLAAAGNPLVVTLSGANYVAPASLAAGSPIVGTQVFVLTTSGTTVTTTNITTDSVVINQGAQGTIMVSVPTTYFPSTAKTLVLGVANQQLSDGGSAPSKAQATYTVNLTASPVVYSITSTASYNQPNPGSAPSVAPYELISIFGANFGVNTTRTPSVAATDNDPNNGIGTQDAFGKYLTTVNASGAGTTASKYVTLSVSFKNVTGSTKTSYAAPILFANATQINAIVPSQVPMTGVTTVTVTYGTLASDGLFTVSTVAADPGIFTLDSSGTGQGAILNDDYSVNGSLHPATAGSPHYVSIYMTGLGAPDSTADDLTSQTPPTGFPAACVAVSNTVKTHGGYLEDVNTKVAANTTAHPPVSAYTPPTPAWTNIDGAAINAARIVTGLYPPCFRADGTTDTVTVTFGSGLTTATAVSAPTSSPIYWVGFSDGSVAGLYQVNVQVPSSLAGLGSIPVQFTMTTSQGTFHSQVVSLYVQ